MDKTIHRSEPTPLSRTLAAVTAIALYAYIYYARIMAPDAAISHEPWLAVIPVMAALYGIRALRRKVTIEEPQDAANQARIQGLRWIKRLATFFLVLGFAATLLVLLGRKISLTATEDVYFAGLGAMALYLVLQGYVVVTYNGLCRDKGVFRYDPRPR
ncbi:MAG: hypothetical protein WDN06_21435 [Asticcacaulis sp.]